MKERKAQFGDAPVLTCLLKWYLAEKWSRVTLNIMYISWGKPNLLAQPLLRAFFFFFARPDQFDQFVINEQQSVPSLIYV